MSDDAAKDFLKGFLDQLRASDQTNRELLATNRELVRSQDGLFTQNNQIITALSAVSLQLGSMSAQLDGLAQRTDYLYDQMGRLGHVLMSDGSQTPIAESYPAAPYPTAIDGAARRFAREAVNGFVSSIFPPGSQGQQRGGRTRRR